MRSASLKTVASTILLLVFAACADEGVGDPCVPESVSCNEEGCGFGVTESFLETDSLQCRSRTCIVHNLKGASAALADPRDICDQDEGVSWPGIDGPNCVTVDQLNEGSYCTCRCGTDGPKGDFEFCKCPKGYVCEEITSLGGDGVRGSYCVRPGG